MEFDTDDPTHVVTPSSRLSSNRRSSLPILHLLPVGRIDRRSKHLDPSLQQPSSLLSPQSSLNLFPLRNLNRLLKFQKPSTISLNTMKGVQTQKKKDTSKTFYVIPASHNGTVTKLETIDTPIKTRVLYAFNLQACPNWPPKKKALSPWDLQRDGRLNAPRNKHHHGACYVKAEFSRSRSHTSVFQRLARSPHWEHVMEARKVSNMSRRVAGRFFIGTDSKIIHMTGNNMRRHGGFTPELIHPVLQARFRWRHACGKLLFSNNVNMLAYKDTALKAHVTFKAVAQAALAISILKHNNDNWSNRKQQIMTNSSTAIAKACIRDNLPYHSFETSTWKKKIDDRPLNRGRRVTNTNLTILLAPAFQKSHTPIHSRRHVSNCVNTLYKVQQKEMDPQSPNFKTACVSDWIRDKPPVIWKRSYFTGTVPLLYKWEQNIRESGESRTLSSHNL
jgi:hypothetical protein